MALVQEVVSELTDVFRKNKGDKRSAHEQSWPILEQATRDPRLLRAAFDAYLRQPRALDKPSFPVVSMTLALNAHFGLVTNCWVPLPSRETHWSTTAVHHHGDMLLSTCTAFGGYQHLYFDRPVRTGADEIFRIDLAADTPHPKHHVLFVDAWRPHCPLYPAGVTVTLALWSHRFPVTWKDHAKRLPFMKGREHTLRSLARRLGIGKHLDLRAVDYYDYYPTERGFVGMKVREQIPHGTVTDHIRNLVCILQATGNESLSTEVSARLPSVRDKGARATSRALIADLRRGLPIEGRLGPQQFGIPHMHFTRDAIDRALDVQRAREDDRGRELAAS